MEYKCTPVGDILKERGLSYARLEQMCGIPKSNLQRFATGKMKRVDMEAVASIAAALCVDPSYLLGEPEVISSLESLGYDIEDLRGTHIRVIDVEHPEVYADFTRQEFDSILRDGDFKAAYEALMNAKKPAPEAGDELTPAQRRAWEFVKQMDDEILDRFIAAAKAFIK